VLQSYYNRECCIELLAKECQKYQNMLRLASPSPDVRRSAEDLRQRHYGSSESVSSMSSGHSIGPPPSVNQTSQGAAHPLMRSSLSYPHIPPTDSSGHDRTPRSSLPLSSLYVVPPSQHIRVMDGTSPSTAAVMQHSPFNLSSDAHFNPRILLRQDGRVEIGRNLPSYNLPGNSPGTFRATETTKPLTVTSGVSYRVNCSGNTGEQSKPTYLSATHVNMLPANEGGGMLGASEKLQNRLSDPMLPTGSTNRSSNAVYINPQQAWVSSPQMPITYVSSLSSSRECLPSPTDVGQTPVSISPVLPFLRSNSPRRSSESVDNPEYAKGTKCVTVMS